jgi:hypothetical protein
MQNDHQPKTIFVISGSSCANREPEIMGLGLADESNMCKFDREARQIRNPDIGEIRHLSSESMNRMSEAVSIEWQSYCIRQ